MAEKFKQDHKETKKLQDNIQTLQLRLATREHQCRSLQEKVKDLENQLAEERKTRLKQESRSLASVSSLPTAHRTTTDKKPPLNPSNVRMPLRRITNNSLPPPSPITLKKRYTSNSMNGKENTARRSSMMTTNREAFPKQRSRASIAVRPPPPPTLASTHLPQPRRRVSIATLRPEPATFSMTTPLRTTTSQFACGSNAQQSLMRSQRRARYSSFFAPLLESRASYEMTTPVSIRRSSKFRASPAAQAADSKVARHPAAIALQRKPLIWSPLKLRGLQNNRRSLVLPSQSYNKMQ